MQPEVCYLTAETAAGRDGIAEVMRHSDVADVDAVPPAWALARVVDGVPVSFLLLDPNRRIDFPNDTGAATIRVTDGTPSVTDVAAPGTPVARWPSTALVQLVTGYRSATLLDAMHRSALPHAALCLLEALFPPCWRLSRNESWTYAR